ncbi:uncharacterized protein BDZ99DRAFT_574087 [Mytilinidion resinicola]|uniref:Uncharacterized protein n=1 Tax=Mytilinidion resinicola TaxID=574789 RepID=A0A6A6YAE6_9PEZI|nr:uncharacterized protein BDZ99DRAFT_574087 [Mytilinidion resinicola]KAF2805792.1 hypothetical protein BDZ99DRAFT_574087 [Mytilinidion resinicola]
MPKQRTLVKEDKRRQAPYSRTQETRAPAPSRATRDPIPSPEPSPPEHNPNSSPAKAKGQPPPPVAERKPSAKRTIEKERMLEERIEIFRRVAAVCEDRHKQNVQIDWRERFWAHVKGDCESYEKQLEAMEKRGARPKGHKNREICREALKILSYVPRSPKDLARRPISLSSQQVQDNVGKQSKGGSSSLDHGKNTYQQPEASSGKPVLGDESSPAPERRNAEKETKNEQRERQQTAQFRKVADLCEAQSKKGISMNWTDPFLAGVKARCEQANLEYTSMQIGNSESKKNASLEIYREALRVLTYTPLSPTDATLCWISGSEDQPDGQTGRLKASNGEKGKSSTKAERGASKKNPVVIEDTEESDEEPATSTESHGPRTDDEEADDAMEDVEEGSAEKTSPFYTKAQDYDDDEEAEDVMDTVEDHVPVETLTRHADRQLNKAVTTVAPTIPTTTPPRATSRTKAARTFLEELAADAAEARALVAGGGIPRRFHNSTSTIPPLTPTLGLVATTAARTMIEELAGGAAEARTLLAEGGIPRRFVTYDTSHIPARPSLFNNQGSRFGPWRGETLPGTRSYGDEEVIAERNRKKSPEWNGEKYVQCQWDKKEETWKVPGTRPL